MNTVQRQTQSRRRRRGGDAVLTRPVSAITRVLPIRWVNSVWPIDVVDLVRAGVGEIFSLGEDA